MRVEIRDIGDWRETVAQLTAEAFDQWADAAPFATENAVEFYQRLRRLPYLPDGDFRIDGPPGRSVPGGAEVLIRPAYCLDPIWPGPRDCDDKSKAAISWNAARLALHGRWLPMRLAVVGEGDRPHHIFPEVHLGGQWVAYDATFPDRSALGCRIYRENVRHEFFLEPPEKLIAHYCNNLT